MTVEKQKWGDKLIGRRDFFWLLPITLVSLATFRIINYDLDLIESSIHSAELRRDIQANELLFRDTYNLRLLWGDSIPSCEGYTTKPTNLYEAKRASDIVWWEINKYPPDMIYLGAKISTVEISSQIWKGDQRIQGTSRVGTIHVAFQADSLPQRNDPQVVEAIQATHHETSHSLVKSCVYADLVNLWNSRCGAEIKIPSCFVDKYAMTGDLEDMVSTMAALMVPNRHADLLHRIKDNPPLRRKYILAREIMLSLSNNRFNDQYFQDLISDRVGVGYWKKDK